jgi:hypothetical protein
MLKHKNPLLKINWWDIVLTTCLGYIITSVNTRKIINHIKKYNDKNIY